MSRLWLRSIWIEPLQPNIKFLTDGRPNVPAEASSNCSAVGLVRRAIFCDAGRCTLRVIIVNRLEYSGKPRANYKRILDLLGKSGKKAFSRLSRYVIHQNLNDDGHGDAQSKWRTVSER